MILRGGDCAAGGEDAFGLGGIGIEDRQRLIEPRIDIRGKLGVVRPVQHQPRLAIAIPNRGNHCQHEIEIGFAALLRGAIEHPRIRHDTDAVSPLLRIRRNHALHQVGDVGREPQLFPLGEAEALKMRHASFSRLRISL